MRSRNISLKAHHLKGLQTPAAESRHPAFTLLSVGRVPEPRRSLNKPGWQTDGLTRPRFLLRYEIDDVSDLTLADVSPIHLSATQDPVADATCWPDCGSHRGTFRFNDSMGER